jgi:uncharacterized protein YqcC (DUF446 family)
MDARVPAVAEQLLLIERELRVQGWWSDQSPSEESLASQQPFCVDSMAFEQCSASRSSSKKSGYSPRVAW